MNAKIVILSLLVIGMLLLLPACSAAHAKNIKEKNNLSLLELLKKIRQLRQGEAKGVPPVLVLLFTVVLAAFIYKYVSNLTPDPEETE